MATHRCPKHDVLFDSHKPPTQDGHAKCPLCNPPARSSDPDAPAGAKQPELQAGRD